MENISSLLVFNSIIKINNNQNCNFIFYFFILDYLIIKDIHKNISRKQKNKKYWINKKIITHLMII